MRVCLLATTVFPRCQRRVRHFAIGCDSLSCSVLTAATIGSRQIVIIPNATATWCQGINHAAKRCVLTLRWHDVCDCFEGPVFDLSARTKLRIEVGLKATKHNRDGKMEIDHRLKSRLDTKLALAEKYDKLSGDARSRDRRVQLSREAEKCRIQAREILRVTASTCRAERGNPESSSRRFAGERW